MAESSKNGQPSGAQKVGNAVEDVSRKAGHFLAVAFARAREEAEDMWAEAQAIRKGQRD